MTERERLIKVLGMTIMTEIAISGEIDVEMLADFIIADRKRIVAPLIKAKLNKIEPYIWDAVEETLKLSGIEVNDGK